VGYLKRVYVSGLFGLVAGILGSVWMWNWFGAGGDYTLVMILDGLIGYLLAGIVIAGFVKPKPAI
ncbi:MAG: hypothetical protein KDK60_00490, partial [Chlamydiia bacterium]|nr:hypothetical protein [Chlamydiia bacterium]